MGAFRTDLSVRLGGRGVRIALSMSNQRHHALRQERGPRASASFGGTPTPKRRDRTIMGPSSCFRRLASEVGLGRATEMRPVGSDASRSWGIDGIAAVVRNRDKGDGGRICGDTQHNVPRPEVETRGGLQVRHYHGIWQVRVDGVFHGDYHREEHARAAAALLRTSPP